MCATSIQPDILNEGMPRMECELVLQECRSMPPDRPGVIAAVDLITQHLYIWHRPTEIEFVEEFVTFKLP